VQFDPVAWRWVFFRLLQVISVVGVDALRFADMGSGLRDGRVLIGLKAMLLSLHMAMLTVSGHGDGKVLNGLKAMLLPLCGYVQIFFWFTTNTVSRNFLDM
jgi:hypothetical protein